MTGRFALALLFGAFSSLAQAQWQQMPGRGTDIGAGARGEVWVLGTDRVDGGHSVHRWAGGGRQRVPGGAVALSAGQEAWRVNAEGNIYRWDARR
jgi:hypothetical protein